MPTSPKNAVILAPDAPAEPTGTHTISVGAVPTEVPDAHENVYGGERSASLGGSDSEPCSDEDEAQEFWRSRDLPPGCFWQHLFPQLRNIPDDVRDIHDGEICRLFHSVCGQSLFTLRRRPCSLTECDLLKLLANVGMTAVHHLVRRPGACHVLRHEWRECRDLLVEKVISTMGEHI